MTYRLRDARKIEDAKKLKELHGNSAEKTKQSKLATDPDKEVQHKNKKGKIPSEPSRQNATKSRSELAKDDAV